MEDTADKIRAHVARLAGAGATSAEVAAAAAEDWRAIGSVLSPIVGKLGFAAILDRSLHLLGEQPPVAIDPDGDPIDAWLQALAGRSAADAVETNERLLRVFCSLLVALIGGSLTERLLRPVWDRPTTSDDAQETTP